MSKGKDKGNGSSHPGAAVAERPAGRFEGEQQMVAREGGSVAGSRRGSSLPILRRFVQELDRAFEGFGGGLMPHWTSGFLRGLGEHGNWLETAGWAPPVEVFQRGNRLIIRADLPGLSKDDVHVEIADKMITIQGERRQEHEERGEDFFHSERSYGSFLRNIPLPEGVEADQAEATFRNGVLEITVPAIQREKSDRRRLDVKG